MSQTQANKLSSSAAEEATGGETAPATPTFAVVVASCDRYGDLWAPFFALWDRYWPERIGKTYLVTNHAQAAFPGVEVLRVGDDVSWSDNLRKALGMIPEEYVLLTVEDLFLCGEVEQAYLERILEWVGRYRPDHVRLNPTEKPYRAFDDVVGSVPPGAPYRTSTVLTLWRKAVLEELLQEGESAWEFELTGSARSDRFPAFYSAKRKLFPVVNGVIKGKWQRSAVARMHSLGIQVDLQRRSRMSRWEAARFALQVLRSKVFTLVPWRARRRLRARLGRSPRRMSAAPGPSTAMACVEPACRDRPRS